MSTSSSTSSIKDVYDVSRTAHIIHTNGFQRVALQFPDELLHVSPAVLQGLQEELQLLRSDKNSVGTSSSSSSLPPQLFILGDTSYGSCCVDEVAAAHGSADVVVHYGHACLSAPSTTPVIYVFGQRQVDAREGIQSTVQALVKEVRESMSLPRRKEKEERDAADDDVEGRRGGENGDKEANRSSILFLWDPDLTHAVPSVLSAVAAELAGYTTQAITTTTITATIATIATIASNEEAEAISFPSPHPCIVIPSLATSYGALRKAHGESKSKGITSSSLGMMTTSPSSATVAAAGAEGEGVGGDGGRSKDQQSTETRQISASPSSFFTFSTCGFTVTLPTVSSSSSSFETLRILYWGDKEARSRMLAAQFAGSQKILRLHVYDKQTSNSGTSTASSSITTTTASASTENAQDNSFVVEDIGARSTRVMSRRYRMVEALRGAGTIGIVCGTLAVEGHTLVTHVLHELIKGSGKGVYTFVLGKLNPAKLGNFPEVDVFVLVACPESTLLDDTVASSYIRPIATPHEVLVALSDYSDCAQSILDTISVNAKEWTGQGIVDFNRLLSVSSAFTTSTTTSPDARIAASRRKQCQCNFNDDGEGKNGDKEEEQKNKQLQQQQSCSCMCADDEEEEGKNKDDENDDDDDEIAVHSLVHGPGGAGRGGGAVKLVRRNKQLQNKHSGAGAGDDTNKNNSSATSEGVVSASISTTTTTTTSSSSSLLMLKPGMTSGGESTSALFALAGGRGGKGLGAAAEYHAEKRHWRGLSYEVEVDTPPSSSSSSSAAAAAANNITTTSGTSNAASSDIVAIIAGGEALKKPAVVLEGRKGIASGYVQEKRFGT